MNSLNFYYNVRLFICSLEALKSLDPRKNVYPEWMEVVQEKPKQEVKINFQIKPKAKKKVEIANEKVIEETVVNK